MQKMLVVAGAALAVFAFPAVSPTQTRAEETITRGQADEIISELRQMRVILERLAGTGLPSASAGAATSLAHGDEVKVAIGTSPVLGRSDAPLTIIEFTDYQCPFCQQFHLTAFQEIMRDYVSPGKVRYVSRDLPLAMHPNAMSAALAARCAKEQDKFWEMRDALIANADELGTDRYGALANELKLDRARFGACLVEERYKPDIAKDVSDAGAAGITGTPSFVIGMSEGDTVAGELVVGALPYAEFDAKLRKLLGAR